MKIKEMTATFGKLDRATLTLGPGLNILEGANEGGKSTWSAFLRAMLYGIPTNQRDRAGFLAEKNRYHPWSGAAMEGSMRVEWRGREIILRRGPKGNTPFGAFQAVDAATGETVPELTAATAGELLTGAEREVFERSAFVGQSALAVDAAPALEKRIAALLSSGQEEVSYSQVERQLKDWLNRRQHNKTGLIPKLEEDMAQKEALLSRLRRALRQREEGQAGLDALASEKARLEQEKAAHKALAERGKWEQYKTAYEEYKAAKGELETLSAQFRNLPSQEELLAAQADFQTLQALTAAQKAKGAEVERLRAETPAPPEKAGLSPADGLLGGLAGLVTAAGLFLALSAAGSGSLTDFAASLTARPMDFGTLGFLALMAGLGLGGAVLWLRLRLKNRDRAAQAQADYQTRLDAALREAESLGREREDKLAALLAFVHTFAPTVTNEFGVSAALSRCLQGESLLAPAQAKLDAAARVLEMARAALGPDPKAPPEVPRAPTLSYAETVARLTTVNEELSRRERMTAAAEGELRSLGDPDLLEAQLEAAREELTRRREEYRAIDLALKTLAQANGVMQARFNPALNRRAGELLATLTGGKYDSLTLTRTFEALARERGEVLPRSVLSLSQGTADQLYLAVRLAVCDLTLPQDDPAPLVLDDALANFDDGRMALALDHLLERARDQQVLLFTCHSREGAACAGRPGVTRLSLS